MELVIFNRHFFLFVFVLIIGYDLNVMDLPLFEASMARLPRPLAIETQFLPPEFLSGSFIQ